MNNYTKTYIYTLRTKEKWYISNFMQIYHNATIPLKHL